MSKVITKLPDITVPLTLKEKNIAFLKSFCKLCNIRSINGIPKLKQYTFKSKELSYQYCAEPYDVLCVSCWNKLKPLDKTFFNYHKNISLIKKIDRIPKNG